ncbi:MAG: tetratricopeptide repeat protein [Rubrivivax sp.]
MKETVETLRRKLQQLKSLHAEGSLDAAAYAAASVPLERQLVDRVVEAPAAAVVPPAGAAGSLRALLLVGLGATVLAFGAAGYWSTRSPGMAGTEAPADQAASPHTDEQFVKAVDRLAQRLKEQPDDADGWAMLARSYARLGRHADAAPAFEKAVALRGNDASLLADYADTLAVQNQRSLEGRPGQLIDRAMQIEPDNPKALALAGTAAFNRKDYAVAVRHWERLAQVAPPDSPLVAQLQNSIGEARSLGALGPARPQPRGAAPSDGVALGAASVSGSVRLSPALAARAAPGDTVFIYARAAEGPRMPLAIVRGQVKDLPLQFRLDDSLSMSPAARLSLHPRIVVSARVSKSAQAASAAGDLIGQSAAIDNRANGVLIEINEIVRN